VYDKVNTAAQTDMKNLYDYKSELEDALDDPTNISQRSALRKELQTTQNQIERGEANARSAKVDPGMIDQARAMTQRRYAMQELDKRIFNNESVVRGNAAYGDEETVDTDAAIREAEKMNKPSKYAPRGSDTRLEQSLGKDGAQQFLQRLYNARRLGQSALSKQELLKAIPGGKFAVGAANLAKTAQTAVQ
jgi:hypothetical protein